MHGVQRGLVLWRGEQRVLQVRRRHVVGYRRVELQRLHGGHILNLGISHLHRV